MTTASADLTTLKIQRNPAPQGNNRGWPKWALGTAVVLVAAVSLFLVFRHSLDGPTEVELTSATLTSPSQANTVLTASGYVVAQVRAAVASKGTGRLEYLSVEEGDRIKKGQIIARLQDDDVLAALAQARANLAVARADSEDAGRTLERTKQLFKSNLASEAELDAADARCLRVNASIRYAEAAVTSAEVGVENTRIRAPFDGTVLTKNADVGEIVAPFASSANSRGAVVTMADMQSVQVEADVSESNITRVTPGQPCEIILDAYPERRYPGYVHKIVPTADRAKATVMTKVAFRSMDDRVLPEMSAKVMFLSKEDDGAKAGAAPILTVPVSSVITRRDRTMVLRVSNGNVSEVPVTVGDVIGDRIAIREGLNPGDQMVLRPDPSLTAGTKVKPRSQ